MDIKYNSKNLNGWAIPTEAFEWICENLPKDSTILELGSGNGTKELVKYFKVYSIEHDEKWLNKVKKSNYIHAPLKEYADEYQWYDIDFLNDLPENYDLLIIDGPIGLDRINILYFLDKFKPNVPYIIDDTNREADNVMAIEIAERLNKTIIEIKGHQKEMMILI